MPSKPKAPAPQVDLSEFFKLSKPKKKPCTVGFALSQMAPADRQKLTAALAVDQGIITNGAIVEWVTSRKQETNVSAVVSHRKGSCTCHDES